VLQLGEADMLVRAAARACLLYQQASKLSSKLSTCVLQLGEADMLVRAAVETLSVSPQVRLPLRVSIRAFVPASK
jgi:hypothetical protein